MEHAILLYLCTFAVMLPLDILFLGVLAKRFFRTQVGGVMGDLNIKAALLFYTLYPAGILMFVNAAPGAIWQECLIFGAAFGFFCYATFDLTSMSIIRGWKWSVALVDISWGTFVTGVSAAGGLMLSQFIRA